MPEEEERGNLEQQLGKHLLDTIREPSARLLGKANGAVGGVNLLGVLFLLFHQVSSGATKSDLSELSKRVQAVQDSSVTKGDLDRVVALSQKDVEGIREDVRDLRLELREASRQEIPTWLRDRLTTMEADVRRLQGVTSNADK